MGKTKAKAKFKVSITVSEGSVGSKIMDFFTRHDLSQHDMGNGLTRSKRLLRHLDNTLPDVEPEERKEYKDEDEVDVKNKEAIKRKPKKKTIPMSNALDSF